MKSFRIPIVLSVFLLSFGLLTLFMIAVSQTLAAPAQQSGVDAERPESQDAETHTSSNPSAAPIVCNGGLIDFDTGIPGDWVVVNNVGGNPVEWTDVAGSGEAANYTGGAGDAASASSDLQGGGSGMYDTELRTPPIDLSTAFTASLTYWANYQNFALVDFLDLDISTDSGATWTTLLSWNEDHGGFRASPGEFVTVDLSAYFGQTAILRWHYYDPGTSTAQDWYAQIDEVSLSCGPVPTDALIQLNKTVGIDSGVCAAADEITVGEGTTVTYCYEVTNTGGVTLTMHDLVDSELGLILDDFSFSLVPFASAFVTQSATITQTTVNTATWTATDGISTAVDIDTATVNVVIPAAYPVCADFESGSLPNFMFAETTSDGGANGRVVVTDTFPHTGSYAMNIDTDCDGCGGSTMQSGTMLVDLAGQSGVVLDFWVHEHGDENNPEDGVFISDDGGTTWSLIQSLNGFPANYERVILDLDAAVANAGMNYVDGFMIRFQSLDDFSVATDGYSFDDICVQPEQPNIEVVPASLTSVQHPDTVMTQSLAINNTGTTTLTWSIDEAPSDCSNLGDVTWVSAEPLTGTTSLSGNDAVDVVFDSTGLSPYGVYTATLCVSSNDPDTPLVSVPLTLSAPGLLVATPDSYDVTIGLNYSATLPLNLANIGGMDVQFEIVEIDGGYTSTLPLVKLKEVAATAVSQVGPDKSLSQEVDSGQITLSSTLIGSHGAIINSSANTPNPWVVIPPMPVGASRPAGAVVDGKFYVLGGEETGGTRTGHVQIYDPDTMTWDNSSPTMPVAVSNLCAAVIDQDIYVPGGYDGISGITNLQVFHANTNSWETIATDPLLAARSGSACASYNNKLYVFGGNDGGSDTDSNWVYDPAAPASTRWTVLANAPVATSWGAALAVGDLLFYSGLGITADLADVYAYDPANNMWITYPSLNTGRGGAGMWAIGEMLYVGGGGWSSYLTSVEAYDTSLGTGGSWVATNSLLQGRRTFAWASSPTTGHLFTGAGWAGAYLNEAEETTFPPILESIPWLHQDPVSGTVVTSNNLDVNITFDATVVTQTGQYYGIMKIKDDTPNAPIQIPVTMTVITNPNFSVALAASISQTSDPGQTVTYTLWLTNTGNVIDSYTLSVSGNSWSTLLSEDQFTLQAGKSAMLTAVVSIPANAPGGTTDVATVTAASADASDSATLTTVTNEYLLYLPFVAKE